VSFRTQQKLVSICSPDFYLKKTVLHKKFLVRIW